MGVLVSSSLGPMALAPLRASYSMDVPSRLAVLLAVVPVSRDNAEMTKFS